MLDRGSALWTVIERINNHVHVCTCICMQGFIYMYMYKCANNCMLEKYVHDIIVINEIIGGGVHVHISQACNC